MNEPVAPFAFRQQCLVLEFLSFRPPACGTFAPASYVDRRLTVGGANPFNVDLGYSATDHPARIVGDCGNLPGEFLVTQAAVRTTQIPESWKPMRA